MWLPVELNNHMEVEKGIRDAFFSSLQNREYTYIVKNRQVVNERISCLSEEDARKILLSFEQCSASYIGTAKLIPCPPFVAFILSEKLGIAYMEHFIDLSEIEPQNVLSGFSRSLIETLCFIVFKSHSSIDSIVLPFKLKVHEITEYEIEQIGEVSRIMRST